MKSNGSSPRRKRHSTTPLFAFILLSPYILGFTSDSTYVYSELMAGLGGGQYVYHDCSGSHARSFADGGITITRKFESPFRLGVTVGGTAVRDGKGFGMAFPDLAFDWRDFSIGTTGVRIGSLHRFYIESKWLDQPPLASGKGMFRAGIGGYLREWDSRFWLGTNVVPYNTGGIAVQYEFPYAANTYIFCNGRYGIDRSSNIEEYGVSVGLRIVRF